MSLDTTWCVSVCIAVFFTDSLNCASSFLVTHTLSYGVAGAGEYTYMNALYPHSNWKKQNPSYFFLFRPSFTFKDSLLPRPHPCDPSSHLPFFQNHASLPSSDLDSARVHLPCHHFLDSPTQDHSCHFSCCYPSSRWNDIASHPSGRFGSFIPYRASHRTEKCEWFEARESKSICLGCEYW